MACQHLMAQTVAPMKKHQDLLLVLVLLVLVLVLVQATAMVMVSPWSKKVRSLSRIRE